VIIDLGFGILDFLDFGFLIADIGFITGKEADLGF